MAVPKKKSARSRSSTRRRAYMRKQQTKLLNFVERAVRNEKGAKKIAARKAPKSDKTITKIAA